MRAPELAAAHAELATNVGKLWTRLVPYDPWEQLDTALDAPVLVDANTYIKPFLGAIEDLDPKDATRYLEDMSKPVCWQGGRSDDWDEEQGVWVIVNGGSRPKYEHARYQSEPDLMLSLYEYVEDTQTCGYVEVHATMIRPGRVVWRSHQVRLLDARLRGEGNGDPLTSPEQVLALNGIVKAVLDIVPPAPGAA